MLRQLDERSSDGLTVALEWDSETNRVSIRCEDTRTPDEPPLCYAVEPREARDAFLHPFAYAPTRNLAACGGGAEREARRLTQWHWHD
jgi:hypothetical protein